MLMKSLALICLAAFVAADIGLELQKNPNYKPPNQSGHSAGHSSGHGSGSSSDHYVSGASSSTDSYARFDASQDGFSNGEGGFSAGEGSFSAGEGSFSNGGGSFSNGGGSFSSGGGSFSNGEQEQALGSRGNFGGVYNGGSSFADAKAAGGPVQEEVQKHFYVFGAGEDDEEVAAPVAQAPAKKQTHYKIIFVKTPDYSKRYQQVIQQQTQRDEKTIVYVLVKKPEDVAQIVQQQQEAYKPNKPEVFFIKYKGGKGGAQGDVPAPGANFQSVQGPSKSLTHGIFNGGAQGGSYSSGLSGRFSDDEAAAAPEVAAPEEEEAPAQEEENFSLSSLIPNRSSAQSLSADEEVAPEEPAIDVRGDDEAPTQHGGAPSDDYLPPNRK